MANLNAGLYESTTYVIWCRTRVALVTGRSAVTDPLAMILLGARIVQSCIHLASLSPTAVTLRFSAFAVQMGIGAWWAWRLLTA